MFPGETGLHGEDNVPFCGEDLRTSSHANLKISPVLFGLKDSVKTPFRFSWFSLSAAPHTSHSGILQHLLNTKPFISSQCFFSQKGRPSPTSEELHLVSSDVLRLDVMQEDSQTSDPLGHVDVLAEQCVVCV